MYDDYFGLLNLSEARFDVQLSVLEKNYIDIQYNFHPDRFLSAADKESAVEHMAKVNQAYFVLKSPIKRAEYILSMRGSKINEVDRSRIVGEVVDFEPGSTELLDEIAACSKGMESSFSKGDMYGAALFTEKLKYLKKINRTGGSV